jgi:hypothetical protein
VTVFGADKYRLVLRTIKRAEGSVSEQYTKMAAELLDTLIGRGLSHAEIDAVCKFAADVITAVEMSGGDPAELFDPDMDKVSTAVLEAAAGAGGRILDGIWGTSGKLLEKGLDAGIKYSPLALVAGLAVPTLAGYAAGRSAGTLTDQPEETVRAIQQRELVALLEENARNARQRKLIDEGRTALTPRRRRRAS